MSEGGYKVFIVEGDREKELFENIKQFFFATKKIKLSHCLQNRTFICYGRH